jgi:hypothetical protein
MHMVCRYTRLTYLDDSPPSAGALDDNCTVTFSLFYKNALVSYLRMHRFKYGNPRCYKHHTTVSVQSRVG